MSIYRRRATWFAGLAALLAPLPIAHPAVVEAALTFSNTQRLTVAVGSDNPEAIRLADVNQDNRPDLLAVNQNTNTISVFLNDGGSGFGQPRTFNVGAGPVAVATGDFDRDGHLDVVTVNGDSNTVTILSGDSTGSFVAGRQDYSVNEGPVGVAVGDFDNDQIPDLAVLSDSAVYLLKSSGDGTFTPFSPASIGTRSAGGFAIAVGLFNADAFPDLVISNVDLDNVSVFLGNGNGTFKAARSQNVGPGPTDIALGDFNGDALQDIAVVDSGEFADLNVSLLFGKGDGTFEGDQRTTAPVNSRAIASADLNGDGRVDIAAASSEVTVGVLLNDATNPTAESGFVWQNFIRGLALGQGQVALQAGDINGDAVRDLVALGEDTNTVAVFINTTLNGSPTATLTPTATLAPTATRTPTASPTPPPPGGGGGCSTAGSNSSNGLWELLLPALLLPVRCLVRRRDR